MNRAEKRRQLKLAKSARNHGAHGPSPAVQQSLDLAVQHHTAGRLDKAKSLYQQILKADPKHPTALHLLGVVALQTGHFDRAVDLMEKAITFKPDFAEAFNNLGTALKSLGRIDEAAGRYKQAIALNPNNAKAYNNLGITQKSLGLYEEAVASYRKALSIDALYEEALNNLGNVLQELGRHEEGIVNCQKAIDLNPNFAEAHNNLGNIYKELGQMDKARPCYQRAIQLRPTFAEAHRHLATLQKYTAYDDHIKAMEAAYRSPNCDDGQKMHLGFALGKAFEDLQAYDKAFVFYQVGNALKRKSYDFSMDQVVQAVDHMKSLFNDELFAKFKNVGCEDKTPIFVLGMPRSGTTLVEQILASHKDVFGAGELIDLDRVVKGCCGAYDDETFGDTLGQTEAKTLTVAGQAYVEALRKHSDSARFIVDKMPHNFWLVGMIKVMLPNAKIIHCCRDARDTCLSIFKNFFPVDGHYYAYELSELAAYHNTYMDLMRHWHTVLPGFVYDLHYEELVADQEPQSKALLDFCGLEWDAVCLNFHQSKRPVNTASAAQVRKPVYKGSVQSWKHFETQLKPLLKALR